MPGHQLVDEDQQRQRAEVVPEIEILRRVILGDVLLPELGQREALIDPANQSSAVLRRRTQVLRPSL